MTTPLHAWKPNAKDLDAANQSGDFAAYLTNASAWLNQSGKLAEAPLLAVDKRKAFDVHVSVNGGGLTGQAGAISLGIARALVEIDVEAHKAVMRQGGMLTRDSRMKERKKYGRRGARRSFQFSKR